MGNITMLLVCRSILPTLEGRDVRPQNDVIDCPNLSMGPARQCHRMRKVLNVAARSQVFSKSGNEVIRHATQDLG